MLLGTLDASVLGNMFTGRRVKRAGKVVSRTGARYNNIDHMVESV